MAILLNLVNNWKAMSTNVYQQIKLKKIKSIENQPRTKTGDISSGAWCSRDRGNGEMTSATRMSKCQEGCVRNERIRVAQASNLRQLQK